MFTIENGVVYEFLYNGKVKQYLGLEFEPKVINETEEESAYQWHQFILEDGQYSAIISENIMIIDGVEYTPIDGIVVIAK